jgi:hypothetical protein
MKRNELRAALSLGVLAAFAAAVGCTGDEAKPGDTSLPDAAGTADALPASDASSPTGDAGGGDPDAAGASDGGARWTVCIIGGACQPEAVATPTCAASQTRLAMRAGGFFNGTSQQVAIHLNGVPPPAGAYPIKNVLNAFDPFTSLAEYASNGPVPNEYATSGTVTVTRDSSGVTAEYVDLQFPKKNVTVSARIRCEGK